MSRHACAMADDSAPHTRLTDWRGIAVGGPGEMVLPMRLLLVDRERARRRKRWWRRVVAKLTITRNARVANRRAAK